MDNEESATGLAWFMGGAALGAVVALLLAPEAGKRTRKQIVKQAKRSGRSIADSGREVFERGRDLYEKGREIAEEAAEMFERGRKLAEKNIDDLI